MSTPLVLTDQIREAIRALINVAKAQPVDMMVLQKRIKTPEGKAAHLAQMTEQTIEIPMAYLVTFSIEKNHPCGTCRHMSMSVQREGRAPNEIGLWMVAQEFGFWGSLKVCTIWPEKLHGHGIAINVVQPINQHTSARN